MKSKKKKESVSENMSLVFVRTPPRNLRRQLFSKYPCGICSTPMSHRDIVTVQPMDEESGFRMIVAHRTCVAGIAVQPGEEK